MTSTAKKKLLRSDIQASFPFLIELTVNGTVKRYANSDEDITYGNNVYTASCFSIKPPSRDNTTVSDGKLTFSSIDQTWIQMVRSTNSRMQVRFIACMVYVANDDTVIEPLDDITFTLTDAQWNESTIEFGMMLDDKMSVLIPCDVASTRTMPAIA